MPTEAELVAELRGLVAAKMAVHAGTGPMPIPQRRKLAEHYTAEALDAYARQAVSDGRKPLSSQAEARISRAIVDRLAGAGALEALLRNERVESIDAQGFDNVFVRYTDG